MSIFEINKIESKKSELIAKRSQIVKLYDVLKFTTEEYDAALSVFGLSASATRTEIAAAEKSVTAEINRLPKVAMKDYLAWKNQQV
jgi:hypothetical protein